MTERAGETTDQAAIARDAELAASAAVQRLARAHYAAQTMDEPLRSGPAGTRVTAAAGLQAARHLERAARSQAHAYIQAARRDGLDWHEIGALLGLGPDAAEDCVTVAEAAFNFAAGRRNAEPWDEVAFYSTCRACGQPITDRGPAHGHPGDCARAFSPHLILLVECARRAQVRTAVPGAHPRGLRSRHRWRGSRSAGAGAWSRQVSSSTASIAVLAACRISG